MGLARYLELGHTNWHDLAIRESCRPWLVLAASQRFITVGRGLEYNWDEGGR